MKHSISVVHIITQLELGGAQKVCLTLVNGLRSEDNYVFLISGSHGILATENLKNNPQNFLLDTLKRDVSLKSAWNEIKNFFSLVALLKKLKKKHPDILVHTHSTKAGIVGRWAAFCVGIKNRIHTIHGFGFHPHQSWHVWFVTYFLEYITSFITTRYICVSSHDIQIGLRYFPYFNKKHTLIRAAIAWHSFSRLQITQKEDFFVIGTISCFKKQKNLFDLLHAFEIVHQKNSRARLEVLGDGILRPYLESWIQEKNLTNVITLHGWQTDVISYMQRWHIFSLTSLWEGLPCAVVEARMLKLPVLTYDTGGIKDVIINGKNGFLYPQKDWQALAHGILTVMQDKKLYEMLAQHKDALDDFNDTAMLQKHMDLYQSCTV